MFEDIYGGGLSPVQTRTNTLSTMNGTDAISCQQICSKNVEMGAALSGSSRGTRFVSVHATWLVYASAPWVMEACSWCSPAGKRAHPLTICRRSCVQKSSQASSLSYDSRFHSVPRYSSASSSSPCTSLSLLLVGHLSRFLRVGGELG